MPSGIVSARPVRGLQLLGVSLLALSLAEAAAAQGPQGGVVARGAARIAAGADRTVIRQSTRRAVIDWRRFDVGRDHTVVFDQPGKSSATLNRVATARQSVIEGAIRAPGTVVIQNGAGVLFTRGATVDTGGLVATSRSVDAGRFQAKGQLALGGRGSGGAVTNRGTITVGEAGLAALVGDRVENAGTIVARRGAVVLAGGTTGTLDLAGDGLLKLAGKGSVASAGTIGGATVLLTVGEAAAALDAAINVEGAVRATAGADGGAIEVHAGSGSARVAGTLDASGSRNGGKVTVTGKRIELTGAARVAARGGAAGGIVRLGGNRSGSGTLPRARELAIAAGAEIAADAGTGTGGVIIAWADATARIDGSLSATGGSKGGFVETSAAAALKLGESARVTAGEGGRWLLDPRNVVIGSSGAAPSGGTVTPPAGAGAYTVSLIAVQAALDAGTDVTVTTVQPAATMPGDITVAAPIAWTGSGDLTLSAERDILISAPVSTAAGDFTASAARSVAVAADITATGTAAVSLLAQTGDIRLSRPRTGDLAVTTAAGDLSLAAGTQVTLRNWYGGLAVATGSGDLHVTAGDMILARGGAGANQWVSIGSAASSGAVRLAAPLIDVVGGIGAGSPAEILAGAGGSLAMSAADRILVQDWAGGSRARVASLGGAPLVLEAAMQCWFGTVQSGTGAADGGPVSVAGAIAATVEPIFSLAAGNDFALAPATPAGVASSYEAALPLAVTTTGSGTITIDAPVSAARLDLVSAEGVALGANATLATTDPGDSLVVSAGAHFANASGADVFAPGGRWLLYMDRFASPSGSLPVPDGFDLYGRSLASSPPASLGFAGSRIVYAEQPTLTLTADSATKTYGTSAPAIGYTATGLRSGDSFATALSGLPTVTAGGTAASAGVGSYRTAVAATASAQGYRLALVDGSVTVTPAALTIAAGDASRRYGAANPGFTAEITGFVLGEDAGVLSGSLALTTAATRTSNVGSYAITASGLASGNYAISYAAGTLAVTKAPLTITAADATRRYGAGDPAFGVRYAGFVAGDDASALAGTLDFATGTSAASNVGRYAITASGLSSRNYAIAWRPGTLTINPAPLTVTATDSARTYGSAGSGFTASYAGFVNGDDAGDLAGSLRFETTASASSPVGTYGVTPGGYANGNYAISYIAGYLTVDPAPLAITANDATRIAGAADPAFTARYDGFVRGEGAGVLDGSLEIASDAGADSPAGAYALTPGGLASANYAISFIDGTLTVLPPPAAAPPPVTGDGDRIVATRGVPPLTPGDASFRTTSAEAPPALDNPFALTYSLGDLVQLSSGDAAADTQGFVPASGGIGAADTQGFVPASGGADPACAGSVGRGADACGRSTTRENYWTSRTAL